ncbi:unnamed protein product [Notodromas monacha]|uniref:Uncharacterized protein n=1 Tax=Notodromas monacha TaxID=399045 RepID=A0A7R9BQZ7_9CRUS|nr:unnamed protein product [Notodromas monacha]CAG0920086.1 unnamed protein product [Notodromas monacha]
MTHVTMNPTNTVIDTKWFVGRKFEDSSFPSNSQQGFHGLNVLGIIKLRQEDLAGGTSHVSTLSIENCVFRSLKSTAGDVRIRVVKIYITQVRRFIPTFHQSSTSNEFFGNQVEVGDRHVSGSSSRNECLGVSSDHDNNAVLNVTNTGRKTREGRNGMGGNWWLPPLLHGLLKLDHQYLHSGHCVLYHELPCLRLLVDLSVRDEDSYGVVTANWIPTVNHVKSHRLTREEILDKCNEALEMAWPDHVEIERKRAIFGMSVPSLRCKFKIPDLVADLNFLLPEERITVKDLREPQAGLLNLTIYCTVRPRDADIIGASRVFLRLGIESQSLCSSEDDEEDAAHDEYRSCLLQPPLQTAIPAEPPQSLRTIGGGSSVFD